MKYEPIAEMTADEIEAKLRNDVPDELLYVPVSVSMYWADWRYAQELCLRLSKHRHWNVRGNAVLGFGHISRVQRMLEKEKVEPVLRAALIDESDYVRGQAHAAVDDVNHFLKWEISA